MRRVVLIGVLSLPALGCSSDDSGSTSADASASSGQPDGARTGTATGDSATRSAADGAARGPSDSGVTPKDGGAFSACPSPSLITNTACSAAEITGFNECVETSCKSKYEECYGVDYERGVFSGPCADYLGCNSKCGCDDTACATACQTSDACNTCQASFSVCSSACVSLLSCATRVRDDAGTR